jgi:hypothetical protein
MIDLHLWLQNLHQNFACYCLSGMSADLSSLKKIKKEKVNDVLMAIAEFPIAEFLIRTVEAINLLSRHQLQISFIISSVILLIPQRCHCFICFSICESIYNLVADS